MNTSRHAAWPLLLAIAVGTAGCGADTQETTAATDAGFAPDLSCELADHEAALAIGRVIGTHQACTVDSDCALLLRNLTCANGASFWTCANVYAVAEEAQLLADIATEFETFCPRTPASCRASGLCIPGEAKCTDGTCVYVTGF